MRAYPSMRKRRGPVGRVAGRGAENVGSVTEAVRGKDWESYPESSTACHMPAGGHQITYDPTVDSGHALHVCRVESLCARLDLEFHFLTFGQRLEAFHANCGEMHEHIFSSFLFNETV